MTELISTSPVITATPSTLASMPVKPTASQLTMPAAAAIRAMQNAMKMALTRPMTPSY
ncbi:MAG: hypothetical protein WDO17_08445 [Alphaproteobacteria bacterium]